MIELTKYEIRLAIQIAREAKSKIIAATQAALAHGLRAAEHTVRVGAGYRTRDRNTLAFVHQAYIFLLTFMNFPFVRSSDICPLCRKEKDIGLVVCWSCYRLHDLRSGNSEAEALIARTESDLSETFNRCHSP